MIYLKKVSTAKPETGNIINSKTIVDKEKNTYSAAIIDTLLSEGGVSETIIQTIINTSKLAAHPIGSYYWSDDATNPSELFGGTWERVKDKFLYALGDDGAAGDEGGEATHTLTESELPKLTGKIVMHSAELATSVASVSGKFTGSSVQSGKYRDGGTYGEASSTQSVGIINLEIGGGQAHNNLPPYIKAYCWKRTA